MRSATTCCCLLLLSLLLVATDGPAHAREGYGISVGPHISTLGYGGHGKLKLSPYLAVNIEGNMFNVNFDKSLRNSSYKFDWHMTNIGLNVEVHPFKNAFFIGGGYFWNNSKLNLRLSSTRDVTIPVTITEEITVEGETFQISFEEEVTFTAEEIGSVNGTIEYAKFLPFLGIGYDSAFNRPNDNLTFYFRAGVLFTGTPTVTLTADGSVADDPDVQAELSREEQSVEDVLGEFGLYPVITVGLRYKF